MADGAQITKWNPAGIIDAALDEEEKRMPMAGAVVLSAAKTLVSKRSGALARSISTRLIRTDRAVMETIGSTMVYARRQELGFIGRDRLGRNVHQRARPYLRPALTRSANAIKRILAAGHLGST